MSTGNHRAGRGAGSLSYALVLALVPVLLVAATSSVEAQSFSTSRGVGGAVVSVDGVIANASADDSGTLQRARAGIVKAIPQGMEKSSSTRIISLGQLDATVREHIERGEQLPAAVECLGGLLRIEYVVVLPEKNDILLVGPAEAWQVGPSGAIVGKNTAQPTMLLDDLVTALRSANAPVKRVISCSIDPTPEGMQRLSTFARRIPAGANPQAVALRVEETLGPQTISVEGVPDTSHFARVMVSADYQMKRIGMGVDPSPVKGLPPFLALIRASGRGLRNMLPRWWMAPDYEPLLRDADGLTWQLRGASVKAMTENDFFDAAGVRRETGKTDGVSQRWADLMTSHYEELSTAKPVFGQLRNCMDLAVAGALIVREDLLAKAQLSLPTLMDSADLKTVDFPAPKKAKSKAAISHRGRPMIACGGVQINPWAIVEGAESSEKLAGVRSRLASERLSERWWD